MSFISTSPLYSTWRQKVFTHINNCSTTNLRCLLKQCKNINSVIFWMKLKDLSIWRGSCHKFIYISEPIYAVYAHPHKENNFIWNLHFFSCSILWWGNRNLSGQDSMGNENVQWLLYRRFSTLNIGDAVHRVVWTNVKYVVIYVIILPVRT